MGKLAEAETDQSLTGRQGPPCSVGVALRALPADDGATLAEWLDDPTKAHAWISRALRDHADLRVNQGAIGRHRIGDCRCR